MRSAVGTSAPMEKSPIVRRSPMSQVLPLSASSSTAASADPWGGWRSTVHPPDRPLPRLGVKRARSHAVISAVRHIKHIVVNICVAAHERLAE